MLRLGEFRQVKPCFIACPTDEIAATFIRWTLVFRQQALSNSNKVHFDQMTRLKLSLRATPAGSGEWWKPNWSAATSWWTRTLILHPGGKQQPGSQWVTGCHSLFTCELLKIHFKSIFFKRGTHVLWCIYQRLFFNASVTSDNRKDRPKWKKFKDECKMFLILEGRCQHRKWWMNTEAVLLKLACWWQDERLRQEQLDVSPLWWRRWRIYEMEPLGRWSCGD